MPAPRLVAAEAPSIIRHRIEVVGHDPALVESAELVNHCAVGFDPAPYRAEIDAPAVCYVVTTEETVLDQSGSREAA